MTNTIENSFSPLLQFDRRDEVGVTAAIGGLTGEQNPWDVACGRAQKCYEDLLFKTRAMTEYLGGRPMDSAISDGVIHPIYRGLGVVFILQRNDPELGVAYISSTTDTAVCPDQVVTAKFWCAASAVSRVTEKQD